MVLLVNNSMNDCSGAAYQHLFDRYFVLQ